MPQHYPGRVLVTGSSGGIGSIVVKALTEAGVDTVGFDIRPPRNGADPVVPTTYAPLADYYALRRAMTGCERVIHLAANPATYSPLDQLLEPNIIGLHHVLEAAAGLKVPRVVLASSVQVARYDHRPARSELAHQQINNWYALTKLMAEHAGEMYHRKHGLDVLAVRIGWFPRRRRHARHIEDAEARDSYLSPDDAARFFSAAATTDWSGFHVLYAMGRPQDDADPAYDLTPGRDVLGYQPEHRFPDGLPDE